MANKPFKLCNATGCNKLVRSQYCDEHAAEHEYKRRQNNKKYQKTRKSITDQGYGADWRRVRNAYIKRHPLCEVCLMHQITKIATLVHHKIPVKENKALRLVYSNLQSLCNECHEDIHGFDRWKHTDSNR